MIDIIMPKMGDGMEEGVILRWLKKPGDKVENGDLIAEVETDKASVDLPSDVEGILVDVLITDGQSAPVGAVIAHLGNRDEMVVPPQPPVPVQPPVPARPTVASPPAPHVEKDKEAPVERHEGSKREIRVVASPLAKRIAADNGIDLSTVQGTGPNGRIVEHDVQQAMKSRKAQPATTRGAVPKVAEQGHKIVQPMSRMRKLIAERTTQTKQNIPHFQVTVSIDMTAVLLLRTQLNSASEEPSAKLSVGDFVTKATALALAKHQAVNALYEDDSIVYCEDINVGFAVSMPDGLIVPVIKQCQHLSLRQISADTKRLAEAARSLKIAPDEMTDATFSISNLGMFGVDDFVAIINPPAVAILAVGGIHKQLVVNDDDTTTIKSLMQVTVSADHRALDGAVVAQFLNTLKAIMESPYKLL